MSDDVSIESCPLVGCSGVVGRCDCQQDGSTLFGGDMTGQNACLIKQVEATELGPVIGALKNRLRRWLAIRLALLIRSVDNEIDKLTLPAFANTPHNLVFQSPRRIGNPDAITIGDDVSLGPGCMLHATRRYPGVFMRGRTGVEPTHYDPCICIGDRVSATGYLTIGAVQDVTIDDDVMMASSIFISDNLHGTSRVDIPFKYQPLERVAPVRIGRGCWIGEHVVILPGVTIGEYTVVGANSVVTRSVPSRCVVAGAPARVLRSWDEDVGGWVACR